MVVNQLLKYGEFGIVLFDNFQVTERTRNLVGHESAARVQISDPPPEEDSGLDEILSLFQLNPPTSE